MILQKIFKSKYHDIRIEARQKFGTLDHLRKKKSCLFDVTLKPPTCH